jgi:hypothetical protein
LKGKLAATELQASKHEEEIMRLRREAAVKIAEVARSIGELASARDRIAALESALVVANAPKSKSVRPKRQ